MALLCGIDEAGRGPVIGPMVICGIVINQKDESKLAEIGAKDSKLLSPRQRERLFDQIKKIAKDYKLVILSPQKIDQTLMAEGTNLNWLEADTSAGIINALKPNKVIIDCPSTNIKAYSAYIKKQLKNPKIDLVAEHKADVKYPVVSAASILAKVTRDREIEQLKKKIGFDFGSGYPSDPVTQEFLNNYHDKYPEIFRKTWKTYKAVAGIKNQKKLGSF